VLLQASGTTFCAGGDLNDMRRRGRAGRDENLAAARELGEMFRAVRLCPVPVVARVQGGAFGGGVGLACACDIVVAGTSAYFALTEARLGLVAGVISPLVIGRLGPARARLHCLLGERIDAREAHRIGLVDVLAKMTTRRGRGRRRAPAAAGGPGPWAGLARVEGRPRCPSPTAWNSRRG
jgi:methylglutaconyl-CoA hydratase